MTLTSYNRINEIHVKRLSGRRDSYLIERRVLSHGDFINLLMEETDRVLNVRLPIKNLTKLSRLWGLVLEEIDSILS